MYNPAILFCHSHRFCPTVPLAGSKEHMTIRKKLCVYFNPLKEDFSIAAVAVGAICTRHQQRECHGSGGAVWAGETERQKASSNVFLVASKERRRGKSPLKASSTQISPQNHADTKHAKIHIAHRYRAHTDTHAHGRAVRDKLNWVRSGGWWAVGGARRRNRRRRRRGRWEPWGWHTHTQHYHRTHTLAITRQESKENAEEIQNKKWNMHAVATPTETPAATAPWGRGPQNARRESSTLRAFSGDTS